MLGGAADDNKKLEIWAEKIRRPLLGVGIDYEKSLHWPTTFAARPASITTPGPCKSNSAVQTKIFQAELETRQTLRASALSVSRDP